MTGVQLIGRDAVVNAYEKISTQSDADVWGLFQGKQPIIFGEGADSLRGWLDDFFQAGSTAGYILRVYDTDGIPTSTTAGVGYIASINFRLIDLYDGSGIAGHSTKLMQRIEGIEKKLAGEDQADEEDLNTIIMGWLKNPEQLNQVVGAFRQLTGSGYSTPSEVGTSVQQTVSGIENTEDKLNTLTTALDCLERKDPRLVEHIVKLAKLATDDPLLFKAVITKLDAL